MGRVVIIFYQILILLYLIFSKEIDSFGLVIIYFSLLFMYLSNNLGKPFYFLLKPSKLILLFVTLNFALGNYAFLKGYYLRGHIANFELYNQFEYIRFANIYFVFSLLLLFIISNFRLIAETKIKNITIGSKKLIYPYLGLFLLFTILGKESNIISVLLLAIMIATVQNLSNIKNRKTRFLSYALLVIFYSVFAYDDKRNVLIVIFSMLLFEIDYRSLVRPRTFIIFIFSGFTLMFLIVCLTILRGYDGFDLIEDWQSFPAYLWTFARNKEVLSWLFHTSETYTTYFHSVRAIEHTISSGNYLYGSTLAKAILVPLPSFLIEKPWSIIDHYTFALYPDFRARGGALAPNAFGEFYMNFGILGSLMLSFLMFVFDLIYVRLFRTGLAQYAAFWFIAYLLFYVRGSGLDLYLAYVYPSLMFAVFLVILKSKKYVRSSYC